MQGYFYCCLLLFIELFFHYWSSTTVKKETRKGLRDVMPTISRRFEQGMPKKFSSLQFFYFSPLVNVSFEK